jgi:hypothetical protein
VKTLGALIQKQRDCKKCALSDKKLAEQEEIKKQLSRQAPWLQARAQ